MSLPIVASDNRLYAPENSNRALEFDYHANVTNNIVEVPHVLLNSSKHLIICTAEYPSQQSFRYNDEIVHVGVIDVNSFYVEKWLQPTDIIHSAVAIAAFPGLEVVEVERKGFTFSTGKEPHTW